MIRRPSAVLPCLLGAMSALALFAATLPAGARADGTATWVSAPAQAPPPPTGATPSPYPASLGYVGDIAFWAPNRGVLITGGSGIVPAGLYAYNGVAWHQLSTVCGGADGRIAFAGPDDFWTISDQRPGQTLTQGTGQLQDVSLCHFVNGAVVNSYAMPIGETDSYEPMDAAACSSPDNCWFGGALDGSGAFHLHWDGTNLTVVNSPADHAIASMTTFGQQVYESVLLQHSDSYSGEDPLDPPVLHVINPSDADPFVDLYPTDDQDPSCRPFCPPLPDYGTSATLPVDPSTLAGFALSADTSAGVSDPQLWAAAGPLNITPTEGEAAASPIVLFYRDDTWTQVVPQLTSFPASLGGSGADDQPINRDDDAALLGESVATLIPESVAAEPGEDAAWIAVNGPGDQAGYVDRLAITGPTSAAFTDQDQLGGPQGVGPRGAISAIACPAAQDCWAATDEGWLFHLTNGTQYPEDADPNYAGVITYRPPDGGTPTLSTGNTNPDALPTTTATSTLGGAPVTITKTKQGKPVITHVGRATLKKGTLILQLPITVRVTARVQLIAKRRHAVVARSGRELLRPGRHVLTVRLNRTRWPTGLALTATPVK